MVFLLQHMAVNAFIIHVKRQQVGVSNPVTATCGGFTYMSTHSKTLKKAVCVDILAVFSLFLPHFCLQNPYLWVVLENLVDALQIMRYPQSASTLSFSWNALVCMS